MKKTKLSLMTAGVLLLLGGSPEIQAGSAFDSSINNPFVFCTMPPPCPFPRSMCKKWKNMCIDSLLLGKQQAAKNQAAYNSAMSGNLNSGTDGTDSNGNTITTTTGINPETQSEDDAYATIQKDSTLNGSSATNKTGMGVSNSGTFNGNGSNNGNYSGYGSNSNGLNGGTLGGSDSNGANGFSSGLNNSGSSMSGSGANGGAFGSNGNGTAVNGFNGDGTTGKSGKNSKNTKGGSSDSQNDSSKSKNGMQYNSNSASFGSRSSITVINKSDSKSKIGNQADVQGPYNMKNDGPLDSLR